MLLPSRVLAPLVQPSRAVQLCCTTPVHSNPPRRVHCQADVRGETAERAMFGEDFGARDPTAGELASGFAEKTLGNYDTNHITRPPDTISKMLGLTAKSCKGNSTGLRLLDEAERELLRQQAPGWRVATSSAGTQCIRQEWKAKDSASAQELLDMFQKVSKEEEHPLAAKLEGADSVVVELSTASAGGLTENDFILAVKVNQLRVVDLIQKKKTRFWA